MATPRRAESGPSLKMPGVINEKREGSPKNMRECSILSFGYQSI
jgi:hypothetical protein